VADNQRQNKMMRDVVVRLRLSKDQRQELHRAKQLWQALVGGLAWCVRRGHGSFLTMEFGQPHLVVRAPIASRSGSEKVRRALARRAVHVQGDWHFWIQYGDWRLRTSSGSLDSEKEPGTALDECLRDLNGQRLCAIKRGASPRSCSWTFDLGAVLDVWPSSEIDDDQWSLYRWNRDVASYGRDGNVSFEESRVHTEEQ
jgi:hypothetical protein